MRAVAEVDVCVWGAVELECFGIGDAGWVAAGWALDGVSWIVTVRGV